MKRCPACSRVYDDDNMRFCLDDGTTLVDKSFAPNDTPTVALPAPPPNTPTMTAPSPGVPPVSPEPWVPGTTTTPQKRNFLPWLIGVAALVLLGAAIVVAVVVLRPTKLVWHLTMQVDAAPTARAAALKQAIPVLENRLSALGISNYGYTTNESSDGVVTFNLPVVSDPERVKRILVDAGKLELCHVISPPSPSPVQTYASKEEAIASLNNGGAAPPNRRVVPYVERAEISGTTKSSKWVVIEAPAIVEGSQLRTASAVRSRAGDDNYDITFSLKPEGADRFGSWTGSHISEFIGVILNDEARSIAYIKGQIFDSGEINGRFTKDAAEDLALTLKSGALPARLIYIKETIDK